MLAIHACIKKACMQQNASAGSSGCRICLLFQGSSSHSHGQLELLRCKCRQCQTHLTSRSTAPPQRLPSRPAWPASAAGPTRVSLIARQPEPAHPQQACLPADLAVPQALNFLDMGAMMCTASAGEAASCHHVTQLLVPGLEQRAWHLPAFMGVRASPGTARPAALCNGCLAAEQLPSMSTSRLGLQEARVVGTRCRVVSAVSGDRAMSTA